MSSEHTEFSPYPICYDVADNDERPKHKNWVIPAGTTMLVDYDHIVQAAKAEAQEQGRQEIIDKVNMWLPGFDARASRVTQDANEIMSYKYSLSELLKTLTTPKEDKETE